MERISGTESNIKSLMKLAENQRDEIHRLTRDRDTLLEALGNKFDDCDEFMKDGYGKLGIYFNGAELKAIKTFIKNAESK